MSQRNLVALIILLIGSQAFAQWGTPVKLGPNINTDSTSERDPFITADGQKLFFISNRAGSLDIWFSTWDNSQNDWGVPEWIGPPVSTVNDDYSPSVSPDGKKLYFGAFGGGLGGWDIWCSNLDSINQQWEVPQNLGPNINSPYLEMSPKISTDGKKLYYATEGRAHPQGQALFTATYDDSLGWQPPVPFPDWINKGGTEEGPYVTANGKDLYFVRWGFYRRIFWSQWQDTNWSIPVLLDTNTINKYTAWSPFIGPDDRLYFSGALDSNAQSTDIWVADKIPTAVDESNETNLPKDFELLQNYPNPFNSSTVIPFKLNSSQKVKLTIFNILGEKIKTLVDQYEKAGNHQVGWDGKDQSYRSMPSGIYLYQLKVGNYVEAKKMQLIK